MGGALSITIATVSMSVYDTRISIAQCNVTVSQLQLTPPGFTLEVQSAVVLQSASTEFQITRCAHEQLDITDCAVVGDVAFLKSTLFSPPRNLAHSAVQISTSTSLAPQSSSSLINCVANCSISDSTVTLSNSSARGSTSFIIHLENSPVLVSMFTKITNGFSIVRTNVLCVGVVTSSRGMRALAFPGDAMLSSTALVFQSVLLGGVTTIMNRSFKGFTNGSIVRLVGCDNMWITNGSKRPLRKSDVGVELRLVEVTQDGQTQRNCDRVATTWTATNIVDDAPEGLDLSPASIVTQGALAVTVAAASIAGGGVAAESQGLALMASMSCSPTALRVAVGPTRFLVSPFYDEGWLWVAMGNLIMGSGAFLLHIGGVFWCSGFSNIGSSDFWAACSRASFPRFSHSLGMLLVGGIARGGTALVFVSQTKSLLSPAVSVMLGVVAITAAVGLDFVALASRKWWLRFMNFQYYIATAFPPVLYRPMFLTAVLPIGRWHPDQKRSMFASFIGNTIEQRVAYGSLNSWTVVLVAMLCGIEVTSSRTWCIAQFSLLLCVYFGSCAAHWLLWPQRTPLSNTLACFAHALNGMTAGICAVAVARASDAATTEFMINVLFALSVLQSATALLRGALVGFTLWLERGASEQVVIQQPWTSEVNKSSLTKFELLSRNVDYHQAKTVAWSNSQSDVNKALPMSSHGLDAHANVDGRLERLIAEACAQRFLRSSC